MSSLNDLTTARVRGGGTYTGNQQYRGNAGMRSCGRCAAFALPVPGRTGHSPRYGFICGTCTEQLAARMAAKQQRNQEDHNVNIMPADTVRAAIERALALDPARDIEAACTAAAQALCQPLEAVLTVAHNAGLLEEATA